MIVGKTTMGEKTAAMMKKKKCVHVSPQCVSPNLWVDSIRIEDVHLFDNWEPLKQHGSCNWIN